MGVEAGRHYGAAPRRNHGLARTGKQCYLGPSCRRTSRPAPGTNAYDEARQAEILRPYRARPLPRGLTRRCSRRGRLTSWSWMRSAGLWVASSGKDGLGRPCAGAPAKLCPTHRAALFDFYVRHHQRRAGFFLGHETLKRRRTRNGAK